MTGSMEPSINVGDMVISKTVSTEDIHVGDVIIYYYSDSSDTVTHRVIDITNENGITYYRTKGDNNNAPDTNLVPYDKVVGKVVTILYGFGKHVSNIFTGTGVIFITIVIIAHYYVSNSKRTRVLAREEVRKTRNISMYPKKTKEG